jgi:NADH dehydrogenase (ubiquinone) 1 alpha subcomplex subunit 13
MVGIGMEACWSSSGHASFITLAYVLDSELAREKMWSRIHLIPLLTAEEDRDLVRRHYADLAREKELMGSNTAVYNSDRCVNLENSFVLIANIFAIARFVRPTYAITPSKVSK